MILKINLPKYQELLVALDQPVDFTVPLYRKQVAKRIALPIAEALGIASNKIFLYLKKFVGDVIKKGDVVAEQKSLISTKQYIADNEGLIVEIDHEKGVVVVETNTEESDIVSCFFTGVIAGIKDNMIEIKVQKAVELPIDNAKTLIGGPVFYQTTKAIISEDTIDQHFIVAEKILPYDTIKMEALGAKGFVVLEAINKKTEMPIIRIREREHLEKIIHHQYSYCLVGNNPSIIFFYN